MDNLTVVLPPNWHDFISSQVAAGGYKDAADYVQALLRDAEKRKAAGKIEKMLEEGIQSGEATPWTKEDLENAKREIRERHARRTGSTK